MKTKILLTAILTSFLSLGLYASDSTEVTENLWTSGKIYVVLTVVLIILLGIVFFLVHLENRIRKLEK